MTALADSAAGYWIALPSPAAFDSVKAAFLAAASALLYSAGLALNDAADFHRDATLHPERPIPSGRLPLGSALVFGVGLLLAGLGAAGAVGVRCLGAAAGIALTILAYDFYLKRSRVLGSAGMGAARALNFVMGYAAVRSPGEMDNLDLAATGVLLVYITATTLISTFEEGPRPRWLLAVLFLVLLLPLAVPAAIGRDARTPVLAMGTIMLAALLWRAAAVLRDPSRESVSTTTRWLVLGVIPLDAMLVMAVNLPLVAAALAALLPLTLVGVWTFRRT